MSLKLTPLQSGSSVDQDGLHGSAAATTRRLARCLAAIRSWHTREVGPGAERTGRQWCDLSVGGTGAIGGEEREIIDLYDLRRAAAIQNLETAQRKAA